MTGIKQASRSKLAAKNIEPIKSYRQTFSLSSGIVKELLGVLLLRLAAGQAEPPVWQLFEKLLRRYVSLRRLGDTV